MAKRKRLTPARMLDVADGAAPAPGPRPPIADVAQDAAAAAALTEVVAELTAAREDGRLVQRLPLEAIKLDHLVRDRLQMDPEDQAALIASLQERGQRTPIEVMALPDGQYGLISGYRRVSALREIPEIDSVLALIRTPADAADAYRAMVDENEMRVDLSFYERARIVLRALEAGVFDTEKQALNGLFPHVPRARRSKIKSFLTVVRALDDDLAFPTAITEKTGLALSQQLTQDPGFARAVTDRLRALRGRSASDEQRSLAASLAATRPAKPDPAPAPAPPAPDVEVLRPGLEMRRMGGGRIELSGDLLDHPPFFIDMMHFLKKHRP